MTRVGAAIVLVAVLAALVGPVLMPFDPAAQELALPRHTSHMRVGLLASAA